ncbi:MAG: hypothetical protein AAGB29_03515 [Planctomycetota bacterium]
MTIEIHPDELRRVVSRAPRPTPQTPIVSEHDVAAYLRDRDAACPRCGYNVRGLTQPRCPECGHALTVAGLKHGEAANIPPVWITATRLGAAGGVLLILLAGVASIAGWSPAARLMSCVCKTTTEGASNAAGYTVGQPPTVFAASFGLPVWLWALLTYLVIIAISLIAWHPFCLNSWRRRLLDAQAVLGLCILFSAAWFIGVQAVWPSLYCTLCNLTHAVGGVAGIAAAATWVLAIRRPPSLHGPTALQAHRHGGAWLLALAIVLTGVMIAGHWV